MLESALHAAGFLGTGLVLLLAYGLPLLLAALAIAEQVRGLQRAEVQAFVPTAWKRALAGSWSLRGRVRLPRRSRLF